MRTIVASALLLLTVAMATLHIALAQSPHREIVFNKYFLYEQLRIYRSRLSSGLGTTPSSEQKLLANASRKDLPPYPGAELIKPPLQGLPDVRKVDLPRIAYDLFADICDGDNGTFVWGVLTGAGRQSLFSNSWSASAALPDGHYLVPVCLCGGQPASNRVLVRLANSEPFIPLLDSGFSYLSTIVMDTCAMDSAAKVYWPPVCHHCSIETTKTCVLMSKTNETSSVMCNCYHGFDSMSRCASIADECTARVMPHSTETGRDLCQVSLGNQCSSDGASYMCSCYMPYFENKTLSNFPNCRGQRPYDRTGVDCESKFCGGQGVCVPAAPLSRPGGGGGGATCRCSSGYAGPNCSAVVANVTLWSEWSDCYPACGNTGSQRRVRECKSADGDGRFCEGLRRQYRRCQPSRCFEGDQFPVFIQSLSDPLPTNLYLWTVASFTGIFILVYCAGLLLAMGLNFQDWKLDAINQSGKLAYTIDEVCDELMQTGDPRLTEDFFRANVFVPHPVVDHLTGVRRLRGFGGRKKKKHDKKAKDKDKKAEAAADSSDGEGEGEGEGGLSGSGSSGSSDEQKQQPAKRLGKINFSTLFNRSKKKLEDEDNVFFDAGEPEAKPDEAEAEAEGEGEAEGAVEEGDIGGDGEGEGEGEGAVEEAEVAEGEYNVIGEDGEAVEATYPGDEGELVGGELAAMGSADAEAPKPRGQRPAS